MNTALETLRQLNLKATGYRQRYTPNAFLTDPVKRNQAQSMGLNRDSLTCRNKLQIDQATRRRNLGC
jgi:hypothetical protein